MTSLITLGLSQVMVGMAAPNGTMSTAVLTKIGKTYEDTCRTAQDASDVTEHFKEGRSAPRVRKKTKKIPILIFLIMDPDEVFLAGYVGGSSDAAKGWGFDGTEVIANIVLKVETKQGLDILIPNVDVETVINADFSAKGIFLVDFTVIPCTASSGKAIQAKAKTAK